MPVTTARKLALAIDPQYDPSTHSIKNANGRIADPDDLVMDNAVVTVTRTTEPVAAESDEPIEPEVDDQTDEQMNAESEDTKEARPYIYKEDDGRMAQRMDTLYILDQMLDDNRWLPVLVALAHTYMKTD